MIEASGALPEGHTLRPDLCIIGAGAAGITLARELAASPLEVVVLESGGEAPDAQTQSLYRGETVGSPQFPLDQSRLRFFGGTTNHWTGMCRPLDPLDFALRPWVPWSGWPVTREGLDPYYRRAHEICELGPYTYDGPFWGERVQLGPSLSRDGMVAKLIQYSPPTRFASRWGGALRTAPRIRVLLRANLRELVPDGERRRVVRAEVVTLEGRRFSVESRAFVLACGGIENPRLLLLSDRLATGGLGNAQDLVGRCFMDHPAAQPLGVISWLRRGARQLARLTRRGELVTQVGLSLSDELQRREGLLNNVLYMAPLRPPERLLGEPILGVEDAFDAADVASARFLHGLEGEGAEARVSPCWIRSEQSPNRESRVVLSEQRDALGQRRVRLEWRLTALEEHTLLRAGELYSLALARSGVARLKRLPGWEQAEPDWWSRVRAGYHHMGTTRMATEPRQGVVDPDCRVFGLDNLYVAGSSVFPTSSYINPTLTIVALTLRLAEHLRERLV